MNINVGSVYTFNQIAKLFRNGIYEEHHLCVTTEDCIGESFIVMRTENAEELYSFILHGYNDSQGYFYKCIYKYPE